MPNLRIMFYNRLSPALFNGLLVLSITSVLTACTGSYPLTDDEIVIELQRTPCYGSCPVHTIKIGKNGKGLYEGVRNSEYTGTYRFRLTTEEMARLERSFENTGFFDLEDRYYRHVSDLPTTWITFRSGGRSKKIMDYYGAPEKLKNLEKEIENLVFSKRMKSRR